MKILGYNYTIELGSDSDRMGAYGRCMSGKQVIQIANNLNREMEDSTILHEILEALKYHLDIGINEQQVMSLEAGLYQTLTEAGVDLAPLLAELREGQDG